MPELPEVETIKRQLDEVLVGKVIDEVEVVKEKSFMGDKAAVIGCQVVGVRRFGKALVIDLQKRIANSEKRRVIDKNSKFETDNLSLVIHLKMTGQLIYEPHGVGSVEHLRHRVAGGHPTGDFVGVLPSKHTRVIFRFQAKNHQLKANSSKLKADGDGVLYFNDQRIFGWVKVVPTAEVEKGAFISKLGKEPSEFGAEEWAKVFKSSKKAVKLRLMDQDKIAGVGNIYANDALWEAGIDPQRPANSLSDNEAEALRVATIKVLEEGIKYGGATAQDGKYLDLQGLGGKYQEHFKAYQREGEACLRKDGGEIKRVTLGGRGTFWCPVCQK